MSDRAARPAMSETPPANPVPFHLWHPIGSLRQYLFFNDPWVEVSGTGGLSGPAGPTGAVRAAGESASCGVERGVTMSV